MSDSLDLGHEPPTLTRLNALMAAGYRIDYSTSQKVGSAIWLDHPAELRVSEKTLILYSTGLLVANVADDPKKAQLRFAPDQELEFTRFVREVPLPTIFERTRSWRLQAIVATVFLVVVAALVLLADALFEVFGWK